jgi:hypothetical protein
LQELRNTEEKTNNGSFMFFVAGLFFLQMEVGIME